MIADFEIMISDFQITALRYNVSGQAQVTLDLMLQLHLLYEYTLPDVPLYSIGEGGLSFDVAGIDVDVDAELGFVLRTVLELSITGKIETGLDATWQYSVVHQHGEIYASQISNSSIQRTQWEIHPTTFEIEGEAVFRFGPAFVAELGLGLFGFNVTAGANLWLFNELGVAFAYPAYEALTSATAPSSLLGVYGNCYSSHYLQYQWNIGCNATMELILIFEVYRTSYSLFNLGMLFGCAVAGPETSTTGSANFSMTVANVTTTDVASLMSMLQDEFAQFESADGTNFLITEQTNVNSFVVSVLDGDTTLASNLCSNIANTGSSLYNSTYVAMNSMIGQVTASC